MTATTIARRTPHAVVIAGPNGSGKSTCARLLLPPDMVFINADMIAQELSGEPGMAANLRAGRILVDRLDQLEDERRDFAVETTLANKKLVPRLQRLKDSGFSTHLIFVYLPSADLAVERVASRVRAGGHDVPEDTVRRRFASGLRQFFRVYAPLVDTWRMYDNSRIADPELIAHGRASFPTRVELPELWAEIESEWNA